MSKQNEILGKQVLPLLKSGRISGVTADARNGGMGAWLEGEKRRKHYNRAVTRAEKEEREDNKRMDWFVVSIHVDGTFTLRSRLGYERNNVSRKDFRLIKGGKSW
jgi:hypothetical protein